ncbi:MAG: PAS domain S-box protein, partial [Mariprofundaceae bacterium]
PIRISVELEGLTKTGEVFPIDLRVNEMNVTGQKLFLGTIRNITERKKLEAEQQRLTLAVEQAQDGIVITDIKGVIEYVNPAFESLTGYDSEALIGQENSLVKSGKMTNVFYKKMWSTILNGQIWHSEFTNKNKMGEIYVVDQAISPLFDENDDIAGFVSVQRDITQAKNERNKLEHTQRLESLGVLAGGIAHDFNNLLTAILGNAALAKSRIDKTSPAVDMIDNIEKASERAAALCKQMLAYSGKGKFIVESINLTDMIEEMMNLLEVSIEKNVVMRLDLSEQLLPIEADASQIQQVIMNLVINASEAIEKKSGIITIHTGVVEIDRDYIKTTYIQDDIEPGRYVAIEVSDTGCGMDTDTLSHIFDPFFTTKFTGRGLGMSAILGIVRGHKGAIKVYSEVGKGTTFKLIFPSSEALEPEEKETVKKSLKNKGHGTILIVDDEETIREIAEIMLEDVGFTILKAKDGVEGVEVFREHQAEIRAVLLDMTMPRMNGEEVFREIRTIQPDVTVILSSGYNEQDATNRFAGKGLAGFIQKPYSPSALQTKVLDILAESND